MKKIFCYVIFILISFAIIITFPKADSCNYKEQATLNKEAKNIGKEYEFIDSDPLNYHFKIYITNVTENFRLEVSSTYNDKKYNYSIADAVDGVITFETLTASTRVKYTIDVVINNGNCIGQTVRKMFITTPAYNPFSTNPWCSEYPDFKYCKKFMDTSGLTIADFNKKISEYITPQTKTEIRKSFNLLDIFKNIWFIIAVSLIFITIIIFVIVIKRKRRL